MKKNAVIILLLACINAAIGGYFIVNLLSKAKVTESKIVSTNKDAELYKKTIENLSEQNKIKDSLNTSQKEQIKEILPENLNFEEILVQVEKLVKMNGAMIEMVSRGDENNSNGLQISQEGQSDDKNVAGKISGTEFSIKITGTYPAIKSIIQDLESNIRIMDVLEIKISTDKENVQDTGDEKSASPNLFLGDIKIRAYYKRNN